MDSVNSVYQNLWKNLVLPRRLPYTDYDMGGELLQFENENFAVRLDFILKNALNEQFSLSIYLPCDKNEKIKHGFNFIVYCHTHTGSRIEGLSMAEKVICSGFSFAVFDFRANGFSSGKYVTLGWYESLDINAVILFLKTEVKAKSICLWGRSMGGSAISFFLSESFRQKLSEEFKIKKKPPINWVCRSAVECVVLDACFPNLTNSLKNLAKSKMSSLPDVFVNLLLNTISKEVQSRAGINLNLINPIDFAHDIQNPIYLILGDQDELVAQDEFVEIYKKVKSQIKRIKIFKGEHADERAAEIYDSCLDFIHNVFKLKQNYSQIKKGALQMEKRRQTQTQIGSISEIPRINPLTKHFEINKNIAVDPLLNVNGMHSEPTSAQKFQPPKQNILIDFSTQKCNQNFKEISEKFPNLDNNLSPLMKVTDLNNNKSEILRRESIGEIQSDEAFLSKAVNLKANVNQLFDPAKINQMNEEELKTQNVMNFREILNEKQISPINYSEIQQLKSSVDVANFAKEYVNKNTLAKKSYIREDRRNNYNPLQQPVIQVNSIRVLNSFYQPGVHPNRESFVVSDRLLNNQVSNYPEMNVHQQNLGEQRMGSFSHKNVSIPSNEVFSNNVQNAPKIAQTGNFDKFKTGNPLMSKLQINNQETNKTTMNSNNLIQQQAQTFVQNQSKPGIQIKMNQIPENKKNEKDIGQQKSKEVYINVVNSRRN